MSRLLRLVAARKGPIREARAGKATPTVLNIAPRVADPEADAAELTKRAKQVTDGGARAAILGANDGLVTNLCLILGLAGASSSVAAVRLAGLASLIAGAFSMAAGEWVSVRSQAELTEGVVAELRRLITRNPALVLNGLAAKLVDDGFDPGLAKKAATELTLDEAQFMAFASKTVFGIDTKAVGSPVTAAVSSFLLFSVGAILPLAPWFFTEGNTAVGASIAITAVTSFLIGFVVSRLAGNSAWRGGMRQLTIVVFAAVVTYGVGKLFGTTVA